MPLRFDFELARPSDESSLRDLLRSTSMPGSLSLSFQREPDFFLAEQAGNLDSQVLVGRDTETGQIVGTASRSFRRLFVDGEQQVVGYLSSLRLLDPVRGGTLLVRGHRYLKTLHADGRVPYYLTSIFDDNAYAVRILASERAGLPTYLPYGRLLTFLLPLYRKRKRRPTPEVRQADSRERLLRAMFCLSRFNRSFQFAPCYRAQDLEGTSNLLPRFAPQNLYVFLQGEEVEGTLGVWDQSFFKQSVVTAYSGLLKVLRPLSNLVSPWGIAPRLPRVGEKMPYLFASLLSSRNCDPGVFRCLLDAVLDGWSDRGYAYLLLGLHERHPLRSVVEEQAAMSLPSSIFVVYWKDLPPFDFPSLTPVPHLEIATL